MQMRAVIDSSSWISLARSGLLPLVERLDVDPVLLDVVRDECVRRGLAGGHADAAALETVLSRFDAQETRQPVPDVDTAVLTAARRLGVLVTNDLALGRRARNLGVSWLRTADLVVWGVRIEKLTTVEGRRAVDALRAAGRITTELAADYLEDL